MEMIESRPDRRHEQCGFTGCANIKSVVTRPRPKLNFTPERKHIVADVPRQFDAIRKAWICPKGPNPEVTPEVIIELEGRGSTDRPASEIDTQSELSTSPPRRVFLL